MITDGDLAYKLPGNNLTLGELCEEMGHTQQVYTQSFNTSRMDWSYRDSHPQARSVAGLRAWYEQLDAKMVEALSGFSEDDLQSKQLDRGHGFTPTLQVQFMIFHEALLIFYAKASIYLKALEKELTDDWKIGIG
jgi:hypothetical protein